MQLSKLAFSKLNVIKEVLSMNTNLAKVVAVMMGFLFLTVYLCYFLHKSFIQLNNFVESIEPI
jgi:hypothetical protein